MHYNKNLITLALSSALFTTATLADDKLADVERITVHGEFRHTNLQQNSSSLTVLTEQTIAQQNAQNLEELAGNTPNLNFSSGSSRARYYQIRGIGETSQFNEPINPSVGIVIDDVDFSGIGSIASMFDVQQAEVFRGPQGTRFGANAMAGLINIKTNDASDKFEGKIKLMAGNYDSYALGTVLSGPATDSLNYRFAIEQYESDGFIDNDYLGRDDTNNRDELTIRTKLNYQASDDLVVDINLFHIDFNNGYDAWTLDNTRNTISDQPGFDDQETNAIGTKFSYSGNNQVDIITLVSFADSDTAYGYDEDWTHVGFHPWEYSSTDHYFRDRSSLTTELRIVSKEDAKLFGNTDWVAGIYRRDEDEDLLRIYTYDADFNSTFETENIAAFAQFDSQLTQQWLLTTGLRVEYRDASYIDSNAQDYSEDETMVGGKVVLSYQASASTLYFGSVNRGYKSGGFNIDPSLNEEYRDFEAEYLWNYELGVKHSFSEQQAYVRAVVFYMDRDDMQVSSSFQEIRDDGSTEFIQYIGNAASGSNYGLEIEAGWQITSAIDVYGSLGMLESEYDDYIDGSGNDLSGRDQTHAPNYQFSLGANYAFAESWLVNVSLEGKDDYYVSDMPQDLAQKTDSYVIFNASLSYFVDDWELKLWSRNLTDEDYYVRGFDQFPNDPTDGYTSYGPYYQFGEPMVWGATVNYSF